MSRYDHCAKNWSQICLKGKKLGVEAQGPTEGSNHRIAEALESFISVDNSRVWITMGELAQFKDVHIIVPPNFNKAMYKDAASRFARKSKEANTLCRYVKDPERKMETTSAGRALGSLTSGTVSVNQ